MRKPVYIVVAPKDQQGQKVIGKSRRYMFALKPDLHSKHCTLFEPDLTAEEVGQLCGGS